MTRRRRRLVIALVLLAILIALLSIAYINYRKTRNIGFGLDLNSGDELGAAPVHVLLRQHGRDRLKHPLGVLVYNDRVYVTDSRASRSTSTDSGSAGYGRSGTASSSSRSTSRRTPRPVSSG